jgi:hypothetical protein
MTYVCCINNCGNEASLTVGRIYKVAPPAENDGDMLRVFDNEGEDYLYPADYFEPVTTNGGARPINR